MVEPDHRMLHMAWKPAQWSSPPPSPSTHSSPCAKEPCSLQAPSPSSYTRSHAQSPAFSSLTCSVLPGLESSPSLRRGSSLACPAAFCRGPGLPGLLWCYGPCEWPLSRPHLGRTDPESLKRKEAVSYCFVPL